ncbi:hypothetical protein CDL12_02241 [Handroanthus impetiginosus]|uniref:Uncharacterized protein n=1 Tax=Handroanthus impetiginosus TaxID=429701 RepID=A0A2G9I5X1_9LAMI|nr:hypothetical protein CDL12_02241 [Handroanthus impetiginosus]
MKVHMGIGKELGLLCFVLLLMILLLENPCFAEDGIKGKFTREKRGSFTAVKVHRNGYRGIASDKDHINGDGVFGAEKRMVYTGPNPLHNR